MTVNEMIVELYDQLGKQSDLDPYSDAEETTIDIGSGGAVKLLGWLNRGYRRILNWRFKNGRIVRFRCTEREVYFPGVEATGTAIGGGANVVVFDGAMSHENDYYNGWVVTITDGTGEGQSREIVDYFSVYVDATGEWFVYAVVGHDWDTTPDATSVCSITKNLYEFVAADSARADENIPLSPTEQAIAVLMVSDMQTDSPLVRASRTTKFSSLESTVGNAPSMFQDVMGGLLFDTTIPAGRYYKVRYFGMPPELSALTDEPALPQQFHEAVLLWAVWWGLRRQQAFGDAYSTKKDLEDTMETALQQFDRGSERDELSLFLEDRYV